MGDEVEECAEGQGVKFRPSLPAFAGGWRASSISLEDWSAQTAVVELRKGSRRLPLIARVEVDLSRGVLVGKLPPGIDRDLAQHKLVSAVTSRAQRMRDGIRDPRGRRAGEASSPALQAEA